MSTPRPLKPYTLVLKPYKEAARRVGGDVHLAPPGGFREVQRPPLRFQREKMFRIGKKCSEFRQKCMYTLNTA